MLTNMIMVWLILLIFSFTTFNGTKRKANKLKESEVMKEALTKLIKITIFMMKKHLAHTINYEDFVCFIDSDLGDPILLEYLK